MKSPLFTLGLVIFTSQALASAKVTAPSLATSVGPLLKVRDYPQAKADDCQLNGRKLLSALDNCELFREKAIAYCASRGGIPTAREMAKFAEKSGLKVEWNPESKQRNLPWSDPFTRLEIEQFKARGYAAFFTGEDSFDTAKVDFYFHRASYQRPKEARKYDLVWTSTPYLDSLNQSYSFMVYSGGFLSIYHGLPEGQNDSAAVRCRR